MGNKALYSYSAGILTIAVHLTIGAILGLAASAILTTPPAWSALTGAVAFFAVTTIWVNRWLLGFDER